MSVRDTDLQAIQQVRDLVERALQAQRRWATFSQAQIDAVIDAMAAAATQAAETLARLAHEETGYGNVPDKIKKNKFCSENVYRAIRPMRTVGILREDKANSLLEVAEPFGLVAAVLPSTNPTSTAIYKILIALKARNAIVLSPHPSAKRSICATAEIMTRAALKAGAPEGLIGCLSQVSGAATQELMRHRKVGVILATGGTGLVRAAYSSGKPAYGVGPGNAPAYIERTANVRKAVADILAGKTFDNGTLCSAEQSIVVDEPLRAAALQELREQGAYFLSAAQANALGGLVIRPGALAPNPAIVGRSAPVLAQMAGFQVPAGTRALVAELRNDQIGREHPLSLEKLSPILAFFTVRNWQEGIELANRLLSFGGEGHTAAIHSQNDSVIREFGVKVHAHRVVVNTPTAHGSVGYSTNVFPAMTLGCGSWGSNITSDNIGPQHLMNIKRVAYETRPVERAFVPAPVAAASKPRPAAPVPARAPARASAPAPVPVAAKPLPDRKTIARVVERFLAERGVPAGSPSVPASNPAAAAVAPPPTPRVVDFVSEEDVRTALERSEKIFISPRTIVTPSARELGAAAGVLVETEAAAAAARRTG